MIKYWNQIPPAFKNKYFLASIAFIVWLSFFDQYNLVFQYKLRSELSKLEDNKNYYLEEIKKNKDDLTSLMTNPKNLEKFAREKYLMKSDNEDLFVIVEE